MRPKEITTKRLRLTALRPEDRSELIGLLTDSEVGRTYIVPDLRTEEEKNTLFERLRSLSADDRRFVFGIYREDKLIGMIHEVTAEEDEIGLGWVISPAEKNKGYASEALEACMASLFSMGFSVVKAAAFAENAASLRVMEKCGMERTGQTETVVYRGESHPCICYAVTKEQKHERN